KELAEAWLSEHSTRTGGEIFIDAASLKMAHPALARRVVRSALRRIGSHLTDITFERIESVFQLLGDGRSGKTIQLQGKLIAEREFDRLVFRHIHEVEPEFLY